MYLGNNIIASWLVFTFYFAHSESLVYAWWLWIRKLEKDFTWRILRVFFAIHLWRPSDIFSRMESYRDNNCGCVLLSDASIPLLCGVLVIVPSSLSGFLATSLRQPNYSKIFGLRGANKKRLWPIRSGTALRPILVLAGLSLSSTSSSCTDNSCIRRICLFFRLYFSLILVLVSIFGFNPYSILGQE
jgi:hypothetical protein